MKNFILTLFATTCFIACNSDKPVTEEEKEDFDALEEINRQDSLRSDSMIKALQQQMKEISDDSIVDNMTN